MTFADVATRIGIAAAVAVSGISHAYLYIHGYQHIPMIGTAFLVQASVSFAVAALILLGGPAWLRWAAAMLAGGSLVAFVLSRTVGLFGFTEQGWQPSPHAAISVGAEVLTVVLWAAYLLDRRRAAAREQARAAPPAAAPRRPRLLFR
jgi:drug/metabolite transporter (DMT)-like permease